MTVIEIEGLAISFSGINVFADVSLQVERGDFVAVVGPNGSGKSTLLKLICKIIKPQAGKIKLFGTDVATFKAWDKVAYIAQAQAQQNRNFPVLVDEVVAMGLLGKRRLALPWFSLDEKEKIACALISVGLQGYGGRFFAALSGGQKQKVLLARALVAEGQLLLLDEPTSGIDADAKLEIYDLLRQINEKNKNTIVMVSHDVELAAAAASKVLCLEKGGICYWGAAQEMKLHRHKGGYYFGYTGENHGNA